MTFMKSKKIILRLKNKIKLINIFLLLFITLAANADVKFPKDFLWGVSNSAAQVESSQNDLWLEWRMRGIIPKSKDDGNPAQRIDFFNDYEKELDLAQKLGVNTFRLSLLWGRLVPKVRDIRIGDKELFDKEVMLGYRRILQAIKDRGMKVVLTLFHHDVPRWAYELGDWNSPTVQIEFDRFARASYYAFSDLVDYWNTFNEPNIYLLVTQTTGLWPYKGKPSILNALNIPLFEGSVIKAQKKMVESHNRFYDFVKKNNHLTPVGATNNVANYHASWFPLNFFAELFEKNYNYSFFDGVHLKSDYIGINYYGIEHIDLSFRAFFKKSAEYSDSGRAIDPRGLNDIIKTLAKKYQKPILITENGIADNKDILRSPYIYEHLASIHEASQTGIEILGYIHWTLSDNWELGDGYCPRFGLVQVNRSNDLERVIRGSFYSFNEIIQNNGFTQKQRELVWAEYQKSIGRDRDMCKTISPKGEVRVEKYKKVDWRFKTR